MTDRSLTLPQMRLLRNIVRDEHDERPMKYGLGNTTARVLVDRGLAVWAETDNWRDYYVPLLPTDAGRAHL